MAAETTLDIIGKLDRLERQLNGFFRNYTGNVNVSISNAQLAALRTSIQNNLTRSPVQIQNVSVSASGIRNFNNSFARATRRTPFLIDNIALSSSGIASLRRSVQAALTGITIPSVTPPTTPRTPRPSPSRPGSSGGGFANNLFDFGVGFGGIMAARRGFEELIKSTLEVNKALTEINVLLNLNQRELADFGNELFTVAKRTAIGFELVSNAALEFSRQGLSVQETLKATTAALNLTRLSGLDSVKATEALTTAYNSFLGEGLDYAEIVDKFATVDAAAAVSSKDLAEAVSRVGSSAKDAGVDFNELLALVGSIRQVTGRTGSTIGNSLKTIFTRLERSKVKDVLGGIGINTDGKSAIQVLKDLSVNFNRLTQAQQAQVAEQVGGVYQINVLRAALGDLNNEYSIYSRLLSEASNSEGEAQRRVDNLTKSLSDLASIAGTNVKQALAGIGQTGLEGNLSNLLTNFNNISDVINNSISDVNSGQADAFQKFGYNAGKGIIEGIGDYITGPGAILLAGIFLAAFTRATRGIGPIISNLMGGRLNAVSGGLAVAGTLGGSLASNFLPGNTPEQRGGQAAASSIGNIISGGATGFALGGAPGAAIGAGITALASVDTVVNSILSKLPEFQNGLDTAKTAFNNFSILSSSILSLQSQYDELSANIAKGDGSQKQLNRVQQELSTELSKLPKDLRDRYLASNNFSQKSAILEEQNSRNAFNLQTSEIAKVLQANSENADLNTSPISKFFGNFFDSVKGAFLNNDDPYTTIESKQAKDLEKFGKSLRDSGKAIGSSSSLTKTQLEQLAAGADNTGTLLNVLGLDGSSALGQFIDQFDPSSTEFKEFNNAIRAAAISTLKFTEKVEEANKGKLKLDISDSAFFRDKSAPEALAAITKAVESTLVNSRDLDNIPKPVAGQPNSLNNALTRRDALLGGINDIKGFADILGLKNSDIKGILSSRIDNSAVGKELMSSNQIIGGDFLRKQIQALLPSFNVRGVDNKFLGGKINEFITSAQNSGDPTQIEKLVKELDEKSGRSNPQEQADLQRLIAFLEIYAKSLRENKAFVAAGKDLTKIVEQEIESATISIDRATVSIPQLGFTAPFLNNPPVQQRTSQQGIASSNPNTANPQGIVNNIEMVLNLSKGDQEAANAARDEATNKKFVDLVQKSVSEIAQQVYGLNGRMKEVEKKNNINPIPLNLNNNP